MSTQDTREAVSILQAAVRLPATGVYDRKLDDALRHAIRLEVARVVEPLSWGHCQEGLPLWAGWISAVEYAVRGTDCWKDLFDMGSVREAAAPYLFELSHVGLRNLYNVGGSRRGVPGVPVPSHVFQAAQPSWEEWKYPEATARAREEAARRSAQDAAAQAAAAVEARAAEAAAAAAQAEAARRAEIARIAAAYAANMARVASTTAQILAAQAAAREAAEAEEQSVAAAQQADTAVRRASTARVAATAAGVAPPTTKTTSTGAKVLAVVGGAALAVGLFVALKGED